MELFTQPFDGQLGDRLIKLASDDKYNTINIVVAFAKNSGVLRLKDSFDQFRERGGALNVFVGIDLQGTSKEALETLHKITDSLYVVHSEGSQTFHTKIYNFLGESHGVAIIGSNNLTSGGLWSNFETSVILTKENHDREYERIQRAIQEQINNLKNLGQSILKIENVEQILQLEEKGYVSNEVYSRTQQVFPGNTDNRDYVPLFGTSTFHPAPPLPSHKQDTSSGQSKDHEDQSVPKFEPTLCYATGKLTGGSGNQLDLSKENKLVKGAAIGTPYQSSKKGCMIGTVGFFGLDPYDYSEEKHFTINYRGVDFHGNKIKFHQGTKRPNQTWRLQLQGKSDRNQTLAAAIAPNGDRAYLKHKIALFKRIDDNYYSMSVVPENQIETLKRKSALWGKSGPNGTGREIGIILEAI